MTRAASKTGSSSSPLNPRDRFTAAVDLYVAARPGYPDALLDAVIERAPGGRVVDLGAGTGISSRAFARLAERRFGPAASVTAVEPNAAMRAAGEAANVGPASTTPSVRYVAGDAEHTGLPAGSADLVVGCQAFHWFDLQIALPEIDRVLVSAGIAAAIWNHRASSPFLDAYEAFLRQWSADYRAIRTVEATIEDLGRLRETECIVIPSSQRLTRGGLHARVWSASYVQHGVMDKIAFDAALDALFDAYASVRPAEPEPAVDFDYRSIAVVWGSNSQRTR